MAQIEKLENENKELKACIAFERSMQIDYGYGDIRKWLMSFRKLDYTLIKNRRLLLDGLIYKVIIYDDRMKVLLHLKSGQHRSEFLMSLLYPEYPDRDNGENLEKEKETAETVSNSVVLGSVGSTPNTMVDYAC